MKLVSFLKNFLGVAKLFLEHVAGSCNSHPPTLLSPLTLLRAHAHGHTCKHALHQHREMGREGSRQWEGAQHSPLFQVLILAGEGHTWQSSPPPLSFPIPTPVFQNTKEYPSGKSCHVWFFKKMHLSFLMILFVSFL